MKITYSVKMSAQELKDLKRILNAADLASELPKGSFKMTKKSRLEVVAVRCKLKRTATCEIEMEISEEILSWMADSVERIAPLVRGLIPQVTNLKGEVLKCVMAAPQDSDPEFEIEEERG